MLKKYASYEVYLTLIWLLCILLVNPIGDFPLNDDWSYGLNTRALTLENKIEFHDWGAMTLIAHTMWGALFCKIFGFSFTVLRFSTLLLGWITLLTTFYLFQESKIKEKHAFGLTLLLLFNPFFFSLSFTYMTDVPFLCFVILSAYFFLKTINDKGNYNIIFAIVFSIIATLIRQPGILIPLAFLPVLLIKNKLSLSGIFQSVSPIIATYGSLYFFTVWRKANFGLSESFGSTEDFFQNFLSSRFSYFLSTKASDIFSHWGFCLLPLLILLLVTLLKKVNWKTHLSAFILTIITSYPFWDKWNYDFSGNLFYNFGMGPKTMGKYPNGFIPANEGYFSIEAWNNLKLIAFSSGVCLLFWIWVRGIQTLRFLFKKQSAEINWAVVFAFANVIGYFIFIIANNFIFGRYFFIVLPFLMLIIYPNQEQLTFNKWIKIPAFLSFGILVLFSIGSTKDYLEWNRARWKAIDYSLNEKKIPLENFNGGFEFNGWNNHGNIRPPHWETLYWWTSNHDSYMVAFSNICGYELEKEFPYHRKIPFKEDKILLLKKKLVGPLDTLTCNAEQLTKDGNHFITNKKEVILQNTDARVTDKVHSGKYAVMVHQQKEYAFTFQLKNISPCEKIWVETWKYPQNNAIKGILVFEGKYLHDYISIVENGEEGWVKLGQSFSIPEDAKETEASFFFFNPSNEKVWFDDLTIIRMK